jgi:hypothetical protein
MTLWDAIDLLMELEEANTENIDLPVYREKDNGEYEEIQNVRIGLGLVGKKFIVLSFNKG